MGGIERGTAGQHSKPKFVEFLGGLGVFSVVSNLLTLASPFFILQVYDRVMTGHSRETLAALLAIVIVLHICQGAIYLVRTRILYHFADHLDFVLGPLAFRASAEAARLRRGADNSSALNDLRAIRTFIVGGGLGALFDVPWSAVFIFLMFLLHPWLGLLSLTGTILIAALPIISQLSFERLPDISAPALPYENAVAGKDGCGRTLGLTARFQQLWSKVRDEARRERRRAESLPEICRAAVRAVKVIQASALLAVAAYLALENMATFGVMMVSSVIAARIAGPIDALISSWSAIVEAKRAWPRLRRTIAAGRSAPLVRKGDAQPHRELTVVNVAAGAPSAKDLAIARVSFTLNAGEMLVIGGPTGAGKSALLRALAGEWPLRYGKVLFDGIDRSLCDQDRLAAVVGYLPQETRLFDGTIRSNIARFDSVYDDAAVIASAKAADAHDYIHKLANGYDTLIGDGGADLSPGLRQKISLSRALIGSPFLLVLDDPTAALDRRGELSLVDALKAHKQRGGVAVLATHSPQLLRLADRVLALENGEPVSVRSRGDVAKLAIAAPADVFRQKQERGGLRAAEIAT
jgi:ATP-binding cassette subfamily C protein PrsD